MTIDDNLKDRDPERMLNPLTGLPGNKEINARLSAVSTETNTMVVYIDLTDFKPYNEVYGFSAGDNVIITLADILRDTCAAVCSKGGYFIGHIGGDDFIVTLDLDSLDGFFRSLDSGFLSARSSFYNQADIYRRFIIGWNRYGSRTRFGLMGICSAAFSPQKQNLWSPSQISEFAGYLKEAAKIKRSEDNILITPSDLEVLPVPLREFMRDMDVPLLQKRTLAEAMGESGFVHYGKLLTELLEEEMPVMLKKSIIFALGRMRYRPAESALLRYTSHNNPHLRTRAVEAIGNIGGSRHLSKIGRMVMDPNPYVSVMAVKSIASIGSPGGLKYLRDIPERSSRWLKTEAQITRCILSDGDVFDSLKELLRDHNPVFRKRAAAALISFPSPESVRVICEVFMVEKIDYVRKSYLYDLRDLARRMPKKDLKDLSGMIWRVYKSAGISYRFIILPVLAMAGYGRIMPLIRRNLSSRSVYRREAALQALGHIDGSDNTFAFRKALKDTSPHIRALAASLIGSAGDMDGMEFLRRSLKDDDIEVKKNAAESIVGLINSIYIKGIK